MDHPKHWIAYVPESGWLIFPDVENGWEQRKPVRGLDPLFLREAPLAKAARAGLKQQSIRPTFQKAA